MRGTLEVAGSLLRVNWVDNDRRDLLRHSMIWKRLVQWWLIGHLGAGIEMRHNRNRLCKQGPQKVSKGEVESKTNKKRE